jgi:hypothetical protein
MFCSKCGTQSDGIGKFCSKCGAPFDGGQRPAENPASFNPVQNNPGQANEPRYNPGPVNTPPYSYSPTNAGCGQGPAINDNMVLSIVSLLFCTPLGIVALMNSNQCKTKLAMGDVNGAAKCANTAKMCGMIGIGASAMVIIISILVSM